MDEGPKFTGTGITREQLFAPDDPEAADIMERGTIEGLCSQIERECFAIMRVHGLPDRHWSYFCDHDGNWSFERPPPPYGLFGIPPGWSVCNDLSFVIRARGIEPDSTVGFAARMLVDVVWMRRAKQEGDSEGVGLHAFYLGQKWAKRRMKENWEADALRGRKLIEGAASTRKAEDDDRRAIVQEILAERGRGRRDAFRVAAQRHPNLGSESTFRSAHYKKASKPSD